MFKNLVDLPFFFQTKYFLFACRVPASLFCTFLFKLLLLKRKCKKNLTAVSFQPVCQSMPKSSRILQVLSFKVLVQLLYNSVLEYFSWILTIWAGNCVFVLYSKFKVWPTEMQQVSSKSFIYWDSRIHFCVKVIKTVFIRARICKPFLEPRNRFSAWPAGTITLFVVPARQAT